MRRLAWSKHEIGCESGARCLSLRSHNQLLGERSGDQQRRSAVWRGVEGRGAALMSLQLVADFDFGNGIAVLSFEFDRRFRNGSAHMADTEQRLHAVLNQAKCDRSSSWNIDFFKLGVQARTAGLLAIITPQFSLKSVDHLVFSRGKTHLLVCVHLTGGS